MLLGHGKNDRRVPFSQFEEYVEAASEANKPLVTLELDEGRSFKETENEQAWYDALVAFLAEYNPAD